MSRVLLVDDDRDQLHIRRLLLERAGHEVHAAWTLEEARAAFQRTSPKVVVVDLRIEAEGDGLELVREFRAADPGVKIIVESGWTADLAGRVEEAMVDAVVGKPAPSARLLDLIAKLARMRAS